MPESFLYLGINDAVLHTIPDAVSGASVHVEKLTMNMDEDELLSYIEAKKRSFSEPEHKKDWIAAYEQVFAHEAFHLYQTLTCSLLSDYSLAKEKRR